MADPQVEIIVSIAGQTLAAAVRQVVPGTSWAEARRLVAGRRAWVNDSECLDDARRLRIGDRVVVLAQPRSAQASRQVRIVYQDADIAVVEKPAGIQTVRRIEEQGWSDQRKQRQPVLLEIVQQLLTEERPEKLPRGPTPRRPPMAVRAVHRLDRDTSGLMLFAGSARAEQELIRRFAKHEIDRVYRAIVHGTMAAPRTIETWIARDRGDGLRGSVPNGNPPGYAQHAVTHIRPVESVGSAYSLIECRLETGRTHQIRIHLAEIGHMLCGEKTYLRPFPNAPAVEDSSGAPRQALHSTELKFSHPITGVPMRFESGWPVDLARWMRGKC